MTMTFERLSWKLAHRLITPAWETETLQSWLPVLLRFRVRSSYRTNRQRDGQARLV